MSLDDIWAEPIIETSASIAGPSNSKSDDNLTSEAAKARSALFLSETEDEEDPGNISRSLRHTSPPTAALPATGINNASQVPEKAQLDEMFAGLDDDDDDPFKDVAPAVDIESLKRQADARVTAASNSRSLGTHDKDKGDKGKKTKRVMPKLDAERLLGHNGFPRLLKEHKNFKMTGKGHESADLARLFRMYHAWTHKMYPKFQFRDTVDRVERLCRSRRLTVNLKVWRDEAHGITSSVGHQVSQDDDDVSALEQDRENEEDNQSMPGLASPSASTRPPTPLTRPGSAASSAPSAPSSTADIDDMDMDALLREEEEIMREMNAVDGTSSSYKPSNPEQDEDALWTAPTGVSITVPNKTIQPGLTRPTSFGEAEEEDLWNMIDEMENQPLVPQENKNIKNAKDAGAIELTDTGSSAIPGQPTIGADWGDMYE